MWEPSNDIKQITTSEKGRFPTRFARKSTELAQTAPERLQMSPVWAVRM